MMGTLRAANGRRRGVRVGLLLAVIGVLVAVAAPASSADGPPCQTKNVRTGVEYKGSDPLAAALGAAQSGDAIWVWGTCTGNWEISKDITLQGKGGSPTLDGGGQFYVLDVPSSVTVTIESLTITNGDFDSGGGIWNHGTVTLDNSSITNSAAGGPGGGIANYGGTVTLNDSSITNSTASSGGGIYNTGTLTLDNSSITNSTGDSGGGGGILNDFGGTVTLSDSTVSGNTSYLGGGGIYISGGVMTLSDSTVSGNTSYLGGGIGISGGAVTLSGSTVSGNSATAGGGIYISGGVMTLSGSSIHDNTAGSDGGGIYSIGGTVTGAQAPSTLCPTDTSGYNVYCNTPDNIS